MKVIADIVAASLLTIPAWIIGADPGDRITAFFSAVLVFIPAFITALALLHRARKGQEIIEAKLETPNELEIGEVIAGIAQLQEILSAQIHTNTRELVTLNEALEHCRQMHEEILSRVTNLEDAHE